MVRDWSKILPLFPSKTGAEFRLRRIGCWNRRFFQIGVCPRARRQDLPFNEIVGSYDPMPNERNEKLVSLDMERFAYWVGQGAGMTPEVADLLGVCGVTPITPAVVEKAYRKRVEQLGQKLSES